MKRSQSTKDLKLKTNNSGLTPDVGCLFSALSRSALETRRWGKKLARLLKAGEIIGLTGELGSGKTCFVRGLAEGLGIGKEAWVRSPSFTLINEYNGRLPLYHIDLFRIKSPREMEELNLREYLFSDGVSVIEWFEYLPDREVEDHLLVVFTYINGDKRKLTFMGYGSRYKEILRGLREQALKGRNRRSQRRCSAFTQKGLAES